MLLFAIYYGLFIIIIPTSDFWKKPSLFKGFPGGSYGKQSACIVQVQSLGWEDPLEKKMATHCRILAWKSPWTEPGGLQSIGS